MSVILPKWDTDGVPACDESCPQHDGKRCEIMGRRPSSVCEPAVRLPVGQCAFCRLRAVIDARPAETERQELMPGHRCYGPRVPR